MTFDQIFKDLKEKKYSPVYLLMGDEPFFIDKISNYIAQNVLSESEKAFNQMVLYGKDTDAATIDTTSRRFPMMSEYLVIIVKEAQELKKFDDLMYYTQKPQSSTILVLNHKYKTVDKRKKVYKEIEKNGVIFQSDKLYENKIPAWIEKYLAEKNFKIEPAASVLLTEFLGNDLSKIANELDKLTIILKPGISINPVHIQDNIGVSKDYNNFELQKAVGEKDILKANMIIHYFANNPKENPITLTISSLFGYFSKLLTYHYTTDKSKNNVAAILKVNPFFVKDYESAATKYNVSKTVQIISLLRTYDMRSKGFGDPGTEPGDLMKELVYKILHI